MKLIKFFITGLLAFVSIHSFAQMKDTLIIDSVVVSYFEYFNEGATKEKIEQNLIQKSPNSNVSEVLQKSTPLLLRTYGHSGASSSLSLRGGGASRTQISWEGFPINSITMGDLDLSLIPAQSFNYIAIDHSASATHFGSGTFGGALELKNIPQKDFKPSASVSLMQGSFGTYKAGASITTGNKLVQYTGTFFESQSDGNFPYFDSIVQATLERKNADYKGYGTIQNMHFAFNKYLESQIGVWYNYKKMHLPSIMGTFPNFTETQIDSTLKSFISLKANLPKSTIIFKSAYMHDFQLYSKNSTTSQIQLDVNNIESIRFLNSIILRKNLLLHYTTELEVQLNTNKALVSTYKEFQKELSNAYITSLQCKYSKFKSNISLRKEFNNSYKIPLIYNWGMEYNCCKNKLIWRGNIGTKYRTPTFNDLYWQTWGNLELKPEYGINYEFGSKQILVNKPKQKLQTDITYYHSKINDMILWAQEGNVWHPFNMAQATLEGVETRIKHSKEFNKVFLFNTLGLDYNNSHISKIYQKDYSESTIGHPLFYVPKFSLLVNSELEYNGWTFRANSNFQSQRYYKIGKTLKPFYNIDLCIHYSFKTKKITTTQSISVKNITDNNYELVRSYPMPGRTFEYSLQFLIN